MGFAEDPREVGREDTPTKKGIDVAHTQIIGIEYLDNKVPKLRSDNCSAILLF